MLVVAECLSSALIKPPLLINPCSLTRVDQNTVMHLSRLSGGSHHGGGDAAPLTGFTTNQGSCQDTTQEWKKHHRTPPTLSKNTARITRLAFQKDPLGKKKVIRFARINTVLVWQLNFLTNASAFQSTFADCWRVPWVGPNGLRYYWHAARMDNCDFNAEARTKSGTF